MHLTLGSLATFQAVSYAWAFFWLDGFAVPAPAQVTQSVGRLAFFYTKSTMFKYADVDEELKK